MDKNKYLLFGGIGFAVAVVVVAGYLVFGRSDSKIDDGQASINGSSTTSNSSTVPLGQQTQAGGLGVTSGNAATSLGQLGGGSQSGIAGTDGKPTTSSDSSSSGSGQSNPFDPTTFAQYDKYKDGTSALFGDALKGDGAELAAGQKAAVYYRGWLTNGTLFDQSQKGADGNLTPFTFTLGNHEVIPGWEQALAGMKVGGVRLIIVPPSVGYGATGQGSIPGNSVLIFQVQLAAVQ